jgi:SAM-dependent methyltransferase
MNPVTQDSFWAERLAKAKNNYKFSVYETSDMDWYEINRAHKHLFNEWKVNGKVLDAACGFGRLAEEFEDYTGVDISQTFINKAKELYPEKNFLCADIHEGLPFKDHGFDWAICVSLKEMLIREMGEEYWSKCLRELKRVAKKVLILEYTKRYDHEII